MTRISPGLTGYIRDVADTHMARLEVVAMRKALGLCTHEDIGDLANAFSRSWRASLLVEL